LSFLKQQNKIVRTTGLQHDAMVQVLIYLSRFLDQDTAKWPFRSSSQAATCYYQSSQSKVERQSH